MSFQIPAPIFSQAAEYCASPRNCCAFRDFSRFLFLEICWSSASFSRLKTRHLCGSVLTKSFYYEVEGQNRSKFLLTWKQNLQWIFKVSEAEGGRTRLANHRTHATVRPSWRACPSDVFQSWQTNLYHIPLATCSTRSFWQWSFTVKKKVVSFLAEHTGAISVGLITKRKETSKLKTRRLLRINAWEERFYTEYGREMESKQFCQEEVTLTLLAFPDGRQPLISVLLTG